MLKNTHKYADIANRYTGQECTLDGVRAHIAGRLLKYAIIGQLPSGYQVDWSWPAVERIMERDGAFKS